MGGPDRNKSQGGTMKYLNALQFANLQIVTRGACSLIRSAAENMELFCTVEPLVSWSSQDLVFFHLRDTARWKCVFVRFFTARVCTLVSSHFLSSASWRIQRWMDQLLEEKIALSWAKGGKFWMRTIQGCTSKFIVVYIARLKPCLNLLLCFSSVSILARKYGISVQAIQKIGPNCRGISVKKSATEKNVEKNCYFSPQMMKRWNCTVELHHQAREKDLPVSGNSLETAARRFAHQEGTANFKTSNGWISRLKTRNKLSFKEQHGEAWTETAWMPGTKESIGCLKSC